MKRRDFLKMGVTGMGVASGLATNLASFNAFAAHTDGYKALVCVFLSGGQDGHDLIIPYDVSSSQSYETIRASLIDGYDVSRRRDNLLDLDGTGSNRSSGSVADGRKFAMPQEMEPLRELYHARKMAIVGNVGPLIEPVTAANYQALRSPTRLFSHNDQQATWMASNPSGITATAKTASTGWGGRFADVMDAAYANRTSSFTSIKAGGGALFVTGVNTTPFTLSADGGLTVTSMGQQFWGSSLPGEGITKNLYGDNLDLRSPFRQDVVSQTTSAINDNLLIREVFARGVDVSDNFPESSLGSQLKIVAKMIANRDALGMKRQIFMVTDGGYDSHSSQAANLPARQEAVATAMRAFYDETVSLGIEDNVMQFTASDFGRTLATNSTGTDHGWGNHHLVVGGAVNGGYIYGDIPDTLGNPSTGHDNYHLGRGRLVPQLSVDQYAMGLATWFGLTTSEALDILPNASNFNQYALYGLYNNGFNQYGVRT